MYPLIWFLPGIDPFYICNNHDLTGVPECPRWIQPGVKGILVGHSRTRPLSGTGPIQWANAYLPVTLRPKTKAPYMELIDYNGKMIKAGEVIFLPQYASEINRMEQALPLLKEYRDAWVLAIKNFRHAIINWRGQGCQYGIPGSVPIASIVFILFIIRADLFYNGWGQQQVPLYV